MKTLIFLLALSAGRAFAGDVPSHAYVFPSDSDNVNQVGIYVLVEQPNVINFLFCTQPNGPVPHSATELKTLIDKYCVSDFKRRDMPGRSDIIRLFHQKDSDRYVELDTSISYSTGNVHQKGMDILSFTRNMIFDNKTKDTLNILFTIQDTVDGQNPTNATDRATKLLAYETDIDYPAITDKPIEQ
jgi:hypothetical protein